MCTIKLVWSILLIFSIVFTQSLTTLADTPIAKDLPPATIENNTVPDKSTVIVLPSNYKTNGKNSTDLKEIREDFADDLGVDYKPSKWEIAKNIAKYLGKAFADDVKSYILFYPLFKVAQLISFFAIYLPSYGIYKKTGIDIPAKVSSVFTKNESMNIIGQNLYNLIPLTLASFMFKWGRDLYSFAKS